MMNYWVSFAKTGDPNEGGNVTWPKYRSEKGQYLDIGVVPVVKTGY
jgi:carboxylesterase type B